MAFDDQLAGALEETLDRMTDTLLAGRNAAGHWEGKLSSSALSTATAVIALTLQSREQAASDPTAGGLSASDSRVGGQAAPGSQSGGLAPSGSRAGGLAAPDSRADGQTAPGPLATAGVDWLIQTQLDDGGWGDTTDSPANVSTTALCWAAVTIAGAGRPGADAALDRVRAWMTRAAGSLEPPALAQTIRLRYGKDRTFSVPILTVLALAGLLDDDSPRHGWRHVPQLPFELAAVPAALYRWLRLPVVSYALPALIAIGLVRHRQRPTRNPVARLVRRIVRTPTLYRLALLQPSSGGFLEATPLTSFVVMSLVAAGETSHPVVAPGIAFLERSARADGSWPIDTNLATWVTTLGVNALSRRSGWRERLPDEERQLLIRWLLDQHHRAYHVYTAAEPGGWAWTDLPGGVPDADDTPGALLALHALSGPNPAPESLDAACAGVDWLLNLQNRDGGIPTFCRGWGALPFDRSSPDLTAHTIRAWNAWRPALPAALAERVERATPRAVHYLEQSQQPDGSWIPLWFGNQQAPDDANPVYGTARVLEGLASLDDDAAPHATEFRAASWLAAARSPDGGWGGAPGVAPSIEETAVALGALSTWSQRARTSSLDHTASLDDTDSPDSTSSVARAGSLDSTTLSAIDTSIEAGVRWLIEATDHGQRVPATPIGLYFARLWYSEALYPRVFTLAALASAAHHARTESRGSSRVSPSPEA
ncbi:MAG: squalene--hopene cyclase [Acidobacteria bacterium]|nr:squalene--hopene cyclase [Acidobacteriota bacterium]